MANPRSSKPEHFESHFWSFVEKSDDCWMWTGALGGGGYGRIRTREGRKQVHRVAYELTFGPIPEDSWVLHRCDNRACVRPDHLFLGTHDDNMHDMIEKKRGWFQTNYEENKEQLQAARQAPKHPPQKRPGFTPNPLRGEDAKNAKLTDEIVKEARRLHDSGECGSRVLARRYGIARGHMQRILNRKAWRHIP